MSLGNAPTSMALVQRAPASGFDPMIKWTWLTASRAVRNAGVAIFGLVVPVALHSGNMKHDENCQKRAWMEINTLAEDGHRKGTEETQGFVMYSQPTVLY